MFRRFPMECRDAFMVVGVTVALLYWAWLQTGS